MSSNLLWTCEAVSFAANEGNQSDCRRPQVEHDASYTCECAAERRVYGRARMDGRNKRAANAPHVGREEAA